MSEIVHITFEKLTGLKGTIEGDFIAYNFGLWDTLFDKSLPVVFLTDGPYGDLVFRQGYKYFVLRPAQQKEIGNYSEHFKHGVNFLIKEWSNGRGERITVNSQSPN